MSNDQLTFVIICNAVYLLWWAESWWWRNVLEMPNA